MDSFFTITPAVVCEQIDNDPVEQIVNKHFLIRYPKQSRKNS